MYFQGFSEGVCVFLNGPDFGEFIFDEDLILVRDDRKETLFLVFGKKVAKRCQTLISQWSGGYGDLGGFHEILR